MKWFNSEIVLLNHSYNCTMNDPMEYMGKTGLSRVIARMRYEINRHVLKRLVKSDKLPSGIMTSERAIEIPLVIHFLENHIKDEPLVELGCVTPYYLFKRENHTVYDYLDPHPANTPKDLRDLSDDDYKTNILTVSTLEHINLSDYGIEQNAINSISVLEKIINNAKKYFISVPLGYNAELDRYLLSHDLGEIYVTRRADNPNDWEIIDKAALTDSQKKFGSYCTATTICIITNCKS